jgi:hypothetical protein
MNPLEKVRKELHIAAKWLLLAGTSLALSCAVGAQIGTPTAAGQEPQGEVIGTIEGQSGGQGLSVKGPMTVQVVGSEVKTLLRSGVDIRVKFGRAKINLADGGTIAVCGPAHISMLKSGNALTVALDSGSVHAQVNGNLALNVFTAQILAKSVAIGEGPQDVLVGFATPGIMCVRAAHGAVRLEEQFGGQSVMVPQGGDVTIANGQIQGMHDATGQCACEGYESTANRMNTAEVSQPASNEEVRKSVELKNSAPKLPSPDKTPAAPKAPSFEPTYQVFMPPLRYDANAKLQDDFDPKLIVLVRRVRVRPTLIFESKVEGDPVAKASGAVTQAASKPQPPVAKPAPAASDGVVDRVKSFFKSLWGHNS